IAKHQGIPEADVPQWMHPYVLVATFIPPNLFLVVYQIFFVEATNLRYNRREQEGFPGDDNA
ncbi:MAG TPA: hypothetical protein VEZ13_04605, partial [Brevibacillus sp.]|nr:hypothetical protein [Brevibacillus sp.]